MIAFLYCRLANFAMKDQGSGIPPDVQLFDIFSEQIASIIQVSHRADSRFAPSQWETTLLCNNVSHWLGTNLQSALSHITETSG